MATDFYTEWLDVPPGHRPPDYYSLLGVELFCADQDAIEKATRRQLTRLDEFALYPDRDTRDAVQDMMNEVARARVDLVNPKRRLTYDQKLARQLDVPVPAEPPPAVKSETLIAPPPKPQAPAPTEPESLPETAAPAPVEAPPPEEVVDVAAQFEKTVWAHLQKWRLNQHEQRLLMAEAAALGVSENDALKIIERNDSEAEVLAEEEYKQRLRRVFTWTAAAAAAVIVAVVLFVTISQWLGASNEKDFQAAIEAARKRLNQGDPDGAEKELAKAGTILPGDSRLEETAIDITLKRQAMEKAFTGMLAQARLHIGRGELDQANNELAKAGAIFPEDPRLKEAIDNVALKRKAVKPFTDMLSRARSLMDRGELDQADNELAKAGAIFPGDPRLREAIDNVALKRKAVKPFTDMLARASSFMDGGELDQADNELAKARAIFPEDPRLKEAIGDNVALKRKAIEKAFTDILTQARRLMDSGKLSQTASELAKIGPRFQQDARYVRLTGELADRSAKRKEKFEQALAAASASLTAGNLEAAAKNLAEAEAILPGNARLAPLRQELALKTPPVHTLILNLGEGVTMKLVRIPAGKFMMGSPKTEIGRKGDEGPPREVTISKAFYMGVTEVTQSQYESITGKNPSRFKGALNPVEQVSWDDATAFCTVLSKKTRRVVCLPTEAQWEYACRAGTKTRFSFGDDDKDLDAHGWCNANSDGKTHPAGRKKPNAFGLYDMHGNVWEWCRDWYDKKFYAKAKNVDPENTTGAKARVLRGGSWSSYPQYCRAADRNWDIPGGRYFINGFRVVVALGGSSPEPAPATKPAPVGKAKVHAKGLIAKLLQGSKVFSRTTDPGENITGDRKRTFLDVLEAVVFMRGKYVFFVVRTAGDFPKPASMAGGKRIDFIWFVDADRRKSTGQSRSGNDYNIHVVLDSRGWRPAFYNVSEVSRAHKVPVSSREVKIDVKGSCVAMCFPARYLASGHFDWWVTASTFNAPNWLPKSGNPPTKRATFTGLLPDRRPK